MARRLRAEPVPRRDTRRSIERQEQAITRGHNFAIKYLHWLGATGIGGSGDAIDKILNKEEVRKLSKEEHQAIRKRAAFLRERDG